MFRDRINLKKTRKSQIVFFIKVKSGGLPAHFTEYWTVPPIHEMNTRGSQSGRVWVTMIFQHSAFFAIVNRVFAGLVDGRTVVGSDSGRSSWW
jgi:hypothetical protein